MVVTTKLSIGFTEATAVSGGNVITGTSIYIVPRKAEAELTHLLWTIRIESDPADGVITYAILDHGPERASVDMTQVSLVQSSIVSAFQAWRNLTSVGVIQTAETIDVDLTETMSRRSNLQSDDEYSIVPAYRTGNAYTAGQSGVLHLTERLFQQIWRDDSGWNDYTFEESAS